MPEIIDELLDISNQRSPAEHSKHMPRHQAVAPPNSDAVIAPLAYDFDVIEVAPDAAQKVHIDALNALGQSLDSVNLMVCWRDPRTAAAMKMANAKVREIFEVAGFGYTPSGGQLAAGSYEVSQGPQRHQTVMALTNRLAQEDATNLDWGQIDIAAFFKTQAEATSVGTATSAPASRTGDIYQKRRIALFVMCGGIALIVLAAFAML